MELTLYARAGCHLCEEMKAALAPLLREFELALNEVNVDSDPALTARFGEEVPVLFLGKLKIAKYRLDIQQLRRRLQEQSRRKNAGDAVKARSAR